MGMVKKILGGEVRDNHGKYGNEGKIGIRKCGKKRKYAGGGTSAGHAQEDFGRGSARQTWEVRERREVWDKKMHEEKGRGMWKSTLEEGTREGMLKRILLGKVPEVQKIEGSAGEKGSTGMWSVTHAKKQSLAGK